MSNCLLFSAFAIAAFNTFRIVIDILLDENCNWLTAELTFIFTILLINKEKGRIGIGAKVSASANLTVSGSTNNDVLFVQNESSSFSFSKEGVIVLPDFSSKTSANYSPADVEGGMWFSGSQFFVGT